MIEWRFKPNSRDDMDIDPIQGEFFTTRDIGNISHNFYYFWRNVGRSGNTDDKLGRWGLGKTVFPAASAINTFWGLTVRKSDARKLLMGQSVLRTHNREDDKKTECGYKPYGM